MCNSYFVPGKFHFGKVSVRRNKMSAGSDNLEGDYVDHTDGMVCLQHIYLLLTN